MSSLEDVPATPPLLLAPMHSSVLPYALHAIFEALGNSYHGKKKWRSWDNLGACFLSSIESSTFLYHFKIVISIWSMMDGAMGAISLQTHLKSFSHRIGLVLSVFAFLKFVSFLFFIIDWRKWNQLDIFSFFGKKRGRCIILVFYYFKVKLFGGKAIFNLIFWG